MSLMEDSRVWIYAILMSDLTHKQVEILGIHGQPIQWVAIDSLQVAVSLDLGNPATAIGLERAFSEYELVLCELCSSRDCLPIRFGTKMPVHQVQELLRNQEQRFLEQLEQFSGCCELSIRWAVPIHLLDRSSAQNSIATTRSTTKESGTSYLARRREQSRITSAAEQLASETGAKLQELHPAAIRKVLSSARKLDSKSMSSAMPSSIEFEANDFSDIIVIEIALLVFKSDAERIKSLLHSHYIHGQAPTLISGPWPMYSFVSE